MESLKTHEDMTNYNAKDMSRLFTCKMEVKFKTIIRSRNVYRNVNRKDF